MSVANGVLAAQVSEGTSRTISIVLFAVFVGITLYITIWASRQTKTAADFYAGGRQFSGLQNGLAIGGDYMSAASFLGIGGLIALFGYDGYLYSIGFLVAWLIALLLVAELLRNSGRFTMADVLAFRMRQRPVRTAAGMKGTTWVQIVKAVLLMSGAALMTVWVLAKYNFNLSSLLGAAADKSGEGAAFLEPGLRYGATDFWSKIDLLSLGLALVLGTAGLPHILIRFYTVPNARAARTSVNWGIGLIGTFYLMTLVLGFGAAALVGSSVIR